MAKLTVDLDKVQTLITQTEEKLATKHELSPSAAAIRWKLRDLRMIVECAERITNLMTDCREDLT